MLDFEEVYAREFPVVYKYLLALCGNPALAEELAQETFYRAIQKSDAFRGSSRSRRLENCLKNRKAGPG